MQPNNVSLQIPLQHSRVEPCKDKGHLLCRNSRQRLCHASFAQTVAPAASIGNIIANNEQTKQSKDRNNHSCNHRQPQLCSFEEKRKDNCISDLLAAAAGHSRECHYTHASPQKQTKAKTYATLIMPAVDADHIKSFIACMWDLQKETESTERSENLWSDHGKETKK